MSDEKKPPQLSTVDTVLAETDSGWRPWIMRSRVEISGTVDQHPGLTPEQVGAKWERMLKAAPEMLELLRKAMPAHQCACSDPAFCIFAEWRALLARIDGQ